MEVEPGVFEKILSHHKESAGVAQDHELTPESLNDVITDFKSAICQATGNDVPTDPWDQLLHATEAVFRSWTNPRAIFYRNHNGIDHNMGTGRFNLDMACYDLMGKHLGLPAWKLMGQQVRQWVNMGWWMPCMSPEDSAREVRVAAERGYRGLKCKARAFYDVIEQSHAMQEAAPPDFRVEFAFNGPPVRSECRR